MQKPITWEDWIKMQDREWLIDRVIKTGPTDPERMYCFSGMSTASEFRALLKKESLECSESAIEGLETYHNQ